MLTARVASAAIFFVLFFLGLFHSAWGWALPTVLAGALISGIYEFIHFGPRRPPLSAISLAMAGALTLLADAYWFDFQHALAILALLTVCSIALEAMVRGEEGPEMAGRTLLSVLYVGLPLALIILIWRRGIAADENNGEHYLIFLVLVTWSTDIGAYCIGRLFGLGVEALLG
jgi:CDP-diglyceride synthetase